MEAESMKSKKPSPLERRPSLLKDFLRDDMSSCSSNGFRSFPRRSCYTSIRNLLEIDLKTRDNIIQNSSTIINRKQLQRSRSKAATTTTTTTISALQKASDVVINVVKHLTFSSVKSPLSSSNKQAGILVLPRSFSRRLRRSFWRSKSSSSSNTKVVVEREMMMNDAIIKVKDIMRWRSFRDLVEEKHKSSSPIHAIIIDTTTTTTTTTSSSTTTISWSDSESDIHSSSGSSESSSSGDNEDVVEQQCKKYLPEKKKKCSNERNVGGAEDSHSIQDKGEALMYEKDHFSPVSVLDFPSEEEDEHSSSSTSFQSSLATMEKKKNKLMQKIRRFESLTQLEPVNLDNRILSFELDHDSIQSPSENYSASVGDNIIEEYDEEQEENIEAEEKARKLLDLVKETVYEESFESNEDIVLIDFFRDEILDRNLIKRLAKGDDDKFDLGLLNVARDWINGYCEELDWGQEESRKVHVKEMERGGNWRDSDHEKEQRELALEMEVMVFDSLMDDLLLDLSS